MRRTGKTTLLTLIRDHLKTDNKLFLDLENPLTKTAISKATLVSFPLVGNLSEKPRRIAD